MATIVFCAHPIPGAVNATLTIAKELKQRGHRIVYIGVADCETLVSPNNLEFITLFEKWFPKTFISEREKTLQFTGLAALRERRKITNRFKSFFEALMTTEKDEFRKIVHNLEADLVVIVPSTYHSLIWALLAYDAGIKSIYLFDTLGRTADSSVPPITTSLKPSETLFNKLRITLAWRRYFFERVIFRLVTSLFGLGINWRQMIKKLATTFKYPLDLIETRDLVTPKLKLPELIPMPQDFDFPSLNNTGRYYIEPSIDLTREQCDFPWEKLNDKRPLIYCALGSLMSLSKEEMKSFLQTVIAASLDYKDWQWVLVTGRMLDADDFADLPPHVVMVQQAPQLELLKKAHLMITHGGINSVKECIFFGVPTIVFPLEFDQYGTAARVDFHGLGLVGDIYKLNSTELSRLISTLDKSSFYRFQTKKMQNIFQKSMDEQLGVKIIENYCLENQTDLETAG